MDQVGGRTAIVVPFALPDALEEIRRAHVANARLGVPAHVTLLFPFVPVSQLTQDDLGTAAAIVRGTKTFDVEFLQAASFDPGPTKEGVVWLAPVPAEPFSRMTEALAAAFPGYLPYEGLHDTVIPHLTLANLDVDTERLSSDARRSLPFGRRATAAVLLAEDQAGCWRVDRELPLG